jgi:hypothetical protein
VDTGDPQLKFVGRVGIMTDLSDDLSQRHEENADTVPVKGHDHFLPHPQKLAIHNLHCIFDADTYNVAKT